MTKRPPFFTDEEVPDLEGSDGRIRTIHHPSLTRRPRGDRYIYSVPKDQLSHEWLLSIVYMVEVILDFPGNFTLQDVADSIDYGPHQFSPRDQKRVAMISEAFHRSINEQLEKCAKGQHMIRGGRCWACEESKLKIVNDDDQD